MNTPAHAVVNLLLLSRRPDNGKTAVIVSGALLPDLVIILFYAWHLVVGTPESQVWSIEYYRPLWQGFFDSFNSIPLILLLMLVGWQAGLPLLLLFATSLLLHCFGDLPLHHDDGHRHFFPFSDWRFMSPVSYWDPTHHGRLAGLVEIAVVLGASAWLYLKKPLLRRWILALLAIYLLFWIYVAMVWE